jgi:4-diphosphocytidyl-2C-methyl-D-erythritol kinase
MSAAPLQNLPPTPVPLRAFLQKRIPVGAGLGGGSSDAARTILALNRLWEGRRSVGELSNFAARFGSDLSFFVYGPSAICAGRGEIVRPFIRPRVRHAVLVLPPIMMPTGEVYRRFDQMALGRVADVTEEPDWQEWAALDARDLLARLVNDLEPPAFAIRPELNDLRRAIEQKLGRTVRMSGSGSSLFSLFDDGADAANAAIHIASSFNVRAEAVEVCPEIRDDLQS